MYTTGCHRAPLISISWCCIFMRQGQLSLQNTPQNLSWPLHWDTVNLRLLSVTSPDASPDNPDGWDQSVLRALTWLDSLVYRSPSRHIRPFCGRAEPKALTWCADRQTDWLWLVLRLSSILLSLFGKVSSALDLYIHRGKNVGAPVDCSPDFDLGFVQTAKEFWSHPNKWRSPNQIEIQGCKKSVMN